MRELYEFEMKDPEDYPNGYLLRTVLFHCGIKLRQMTANVRLFVKEQPFEVDKID